MKKRINWNILILSFVLVYVVALAGGIFASKGINTFWYQTIKPPITPPNWVFPVVWNILFFLIAISLYFSLTTVKDKKSELKIEFVFAINFFFNFLWSLFYFYLRNPFIAFFDLIFLWLSIIAMIYFTYKINKKSAWLLIPYLLWVSFAEVLNYLSVFR